MSPWQRTLAERVSISGVALHTGQVTTVVLAPAAPETGIVFVRADLAGEPEIAAGVGQLRGSALATTLGRGEAMVGTVEHLLAALSALGIDNARVEVTGPELPILDGSAAGYCALIRSAGVVEQGRPRRMLVVRRRIEVRDGEKLARLAPAPRFAVQCSIEFAHPVIGSQIFAAEIGPELFEREIAPARTFGFLSEVQQHQRLGLARGGSLENAIVLDESRVLNPGGLRFPDEMVRHKVLDALGDLALLGIPVVGRLELHKAGHALNQRLVAEILSQPDAFAVIPSPEPARAAVGAA